jgi:hypothetical protein
MAPSERLIYSEDWHEEVFKNFPGIHEALVDRAFAGRAH